MFAKLWNDEAGVLNIEYIILATLVALAAIVGANAVGLAVNSELSEIANAVRAIDQSYAYSGFSYCTLASVNGAKVTDTAGTAGATIAPVNSVITVTLCSDTAP